MAMLGLEAQMTIQELARRGVSGRQIARTPEVTEGTVRYHRRRAATGAVDGRSQQAFLASGWHEKIADWLAACEAAEEAVNLVVLYAWLVKEAGYPGSLRSLQRYVHARFPKPRLRARPRVGRRGRLFHVDQPDGDVDGVDPAVIVVDLGGELVFGLRLEVVVHSVLGDDLVRRIQVEGTTVYPLRRKVRVSPSSSVA